MSDRWNKYEKILDLAKKESSDTLFKNEQELDSEIKEVRKRLSDLILLKEAFLDTHQKRLKIMVHAEEQKAKKAGAKQLVQVLNERGLSKKDGAYYLGVNETRVANLCNESLVVTPPSFEDLIRLYLVFGITPNDFLGIDKSPAEPKKLQKEGVTL